MSNKWGQRRAGEWVMMGQKACRIALARCWKQNERDCRLLFTACTNNSWYWCMVLAVTCTAIVSKLVWKNLHLFETHNATLKKGLGQYLYWSGSSAGLTQFRSHLCLESISVSESQELWANKKSWRFRLGISGWENRSKTHELCKNSVCLCFGFD